MLRKSLSISFALLALAAGLDGSSGRAGSSGLPLVRVVRESASARSVARTAHRRRGTKHTSKAAERKRKRAVQCVPSKAAPNEPTGRCVKTPPTSVTPPPSPSVPVSAQPESAAESTQGLTTTINSHPAPPSTAPTSTEPTVATVTPWKTHAAPIAWADGRIYYNQREESGLYNGWAANPDGSDAVCVTCGSVYPTGTQHGVSDATPSGQYLLATVERASHPPISDGLPEAAPGDGAFNDLWLQTSDGSHAWQLTNEKSSGTSALIWARFDSTGTRVVWSEQWQWGVPFGGWRMHVAEITWSGGVPSLTNEDTLQSTGILEPYGFTPDGSHVLFAADVLAGTSWDDLQIMTIPANLSGTAVRLSPEDTSDTGYFSNYNEFAFTMPESGRIIFARSVGAYFESMEYWTMNPDGSDPKQLTWLSVPWSSQYHGYPSLAGGLAFNPTDPKQFVASIETDYRGDYKSLMITLN
jgi:hypothetical protein